MPQDLDYTGMLDRYALGIAAPGEIRALEARAVQDPDFAERLGAVREEQAALAKREAIVPPAALRERIRNEVSRIQELEASSGRPPVLHAGTTIAQFSRWVNDPALVRPADAGNVHLIMLDEQPDRQTALAWLVTEQEAEVHDDMVERFLILEGTCDVFLDDERHALVPGDVFTIPMHRTHSVKVTSPVICKVILQRVMAI